MTPAARAPEAVAPGAYLSFPISALAIVFFWISRVPS